mgnify:CR=1 FL=1
MAKTMTPSAESKTMTDGQITKAVAAYRALLEKHAPEFNSEVVQAVLGNQGLAGEMFALFRQRVEAKASEVVRRVTGIDRTFKPSDVIAKVVATGRKSCVDDKVVETMPKGEGENVEVVFFTLGWFISDDDLEKEYEKRGLKPADPYSLAAINRDDPAFADEKPNCTHWKDSKGKWCYAAFSRWGGGRRVLVRRRDSAWRDAWWFAGLRK